MPVGMPRISTCRWVPTAPRSSRRSGRSAALRGIPYGELRSYRDIAETLGKPRAVPAGWCAANGRNPLPIVVPCHRVVGSNGKLTGFAGGPG